MNHIDFILELVKRNSDYFIKLKQKLYQIIIYFYSYFFEILDAFNSSGL